MNLIKKLKTASNEKMVWIASSKNYFFIIQEKNYDGKQTQQLLLFLKISKN